jgi:uncharacterized protein YndB with AHSA1/START domain/DNA-binding transcriptional ArsR family regulator
MTAPDVFAVLSNPVRRRILELLLERPHTVNDLVDEFRLHRPAVSEHLQVLRLAKLVRDERRGRERYYHIEPARLLAVNEWLKPFERYWRERLLALERTLDDEGGIMIQPGTIRLSQFINHPPAKVWQAITDPKIHAKWWAAGDVRAVVGHRFTLDMGPWGQQSCEIIAVEPERLLSYSFAPGTLDTTVTWRLEPENSGTRLHLEHSGFDLDSPLGKTAFEGMSRGWPSVLERIAPAIDSSVGA